MNKIAHAVESLVKYSSKSKLSQQIIRAKLHNIIKLATNKTPLYGHTSEVTSYLVEDYPYGFNLRCRIRYWLEYKPKKGFRLMSQTEDPKRLRWNKSKADKYMEWAGNMYLDSKGHVNWEGLGVYSDADKFLEFVKTFPKSDFSIIKAIVPKKMKILEFQIGGGPLFKGQDKPTPDDIGRYRKELEIWEDVMKLL